MIFESASCGDRAATKVRIVTGRWQGRVGTVVRVVDGPGTYMVRFTPNARPIPFAQCEVEVTK